MRTFLLLQVILLSAIAAGCSPQEFDLLLYGENGNELIFRCPGGEEITLAINDQGTPSPGGQALACLGISTGTCPSTDASGGVTAGDSECLSLDFNPLLGTCVETFFSCFIPLGPCQNSSADVARWDNGYRVEHDPSSDNEGAYFGPSGGEACAMFSEVTPFDLLPGTETEIQVLKPR